MTWDDADFDSPDPLVRHNAHQAAKGRAPLPDDVRKADRERGGLAAAGGAQAVGEAEAYEILRDQSNDPDGNAEAAWRESRLTETVPSYLERAGEARRLYDEEGLLHREIAERLGISRTYVSQLLTDPDGSLMKQRKLGYRGVCTGCGGETSGSEGPTFANRPGALCVDCARRNLKVWTREKVVDAIQRWAAEHDGKPPTAPMWLSGIENRGEGYPSANSVYGGSGVFDSWADAIESSGFPRPRVGHYDRGGHWRQQLEAAGRARWEERLPGYQATLHAFWEQHRRAPIIGESIQLGLPRARKIRRWTGLARHEWYRSLLGENVPANRPGATGNPRRRHNMASRNRDYLVLLVTVDGYDVIGATPAATTGEAVARLAPDPSATYAAVPVSALTKHRLEQKLVAVAAE